MPRKPTDAVDTITLEPRPSRGFVLRVLTADAHAVHPLPSEGTVLIGRAGQADVCIEDPSISRAHARVHVGEPFQIEDLGSANGTAVAGRRLAADTPTPVAVGEVIDLGSVMLIIQPAYVRGASGAAADTGAGSAAMAQLDRLVERIAPSSLSVLILGETGVGKEVMSERIHRLSPRAGRPLVKINCAALSEALLASELFGHEKGAFTGADAAKPGLIESADGGTVLLDEVGELPLETQAKLLRVVEDRQVQRVGSVRPRPVDVRFLAATNRDLDAEVEAGRFRRDLLYRLNALTLFLPPLRERVSEIPTLAEQFLRAASKASGRALTLSPAALDALLRHRWPGNVRELRNVIERAALLCSGAQITPAELPFAETARAVPEALAPVRAPLAVPPGTTTPPAALKDAVDALERQRILDALEACGGNQTQAAKRLGIARGTLLSRLEAYGVPRPRKPRRG